MNVDIDEIAPDRFLVRNDRVRPLLRGEGLIDGSHFTLQSQRRDGWLARIRMAGFNVRTLEDRVARLRAIMPGLELDDEVFRPLLTAKEQLAGFDDERLRWRDLPVVEQAGKRGVWLRLNQPVRRRKSRGGGDYFITVPQRGEEAGLLSVTEDDALLQAYSLIRNSLRRARLEFTTAAGRYQVEGDGVVLPPRHTETLDLLNEEKRRWSFGPQTARLAEEVFASLGIVLVERPAA